MACAAQAISSPRAVGAHPLWGPLFETAVVAEIRKQCSILSPRPNLYHWRTYGGAEVDVLIERDGVLFPIEMKAKSNPGRGDTTGISAFRRANPGVRTAAGLVIAPTDKVLRISERDFAVPWDLAGRRPAPPA